MWQNRTDETMLKKNKEGEDWSALLDVVPSMFYVLTGYVIIMLLANTAAVAMNVEEKIKIDSGQQKGVDGGDNR